MIKNTREIATTPERRAALRILEAGLAACDLGQAIRKNITLDGNTLRVHDTAINLSLFQHIYVVGAGKGATTLAAAVEELLGKRIEDGVVVDLVPRKLKRIRCLRGTHPLPSAMNRKAAQAIRRMITGHGTDTLILCLLCGGGSVLMADPYASHPSAQKTVQQLLASGATINEVNTVRKKMFSLAGGNLAATAYPARVLSLIVSDVVGDDASVIASGPTIMDETTLGDAKKVLRRYRLSAAGLRETPKDPDIFGRANNIIILSNKDAVEAMVQAATRLKLVPSVLGTSETGEARAEATRLVQLAPQQKKTALIAAGETTVTVKGKGTGGRNQELAAAAIPLLEGKNNIALASLGTDGLDHSDVAGAIIDGKTAFYAQKKKLDVAQALLNNDTYAFFKKLGKHQIKTGPTGTNVSDIMVVVRGPI